MKIAIIFICVLIINLSASAVSFAGSSNFVNVTLANRISLDLPRSWYVVTTEGLELLETSLESLGVNSPSGILIMCLRRDPYAQITVTIDRSRHPRLLDAKQLDSGYLNGTMDACRLQNMRLIEWLGTRKTSINGRQAFTYEYLRQSQGNPVTFVQSNNFYLNGTTRITLILAYHRDAGAIIRPILDRVKRSIVVR